MSTDQITNSRLQYFILNKEILTSPSFYIIPTGRRSKFSFVLHLKESKATTPNPQRLPLQSLAYSEIKRNSFLPLCQSVIQFKRLFKTFPNKAWKGKDGGCFEYWSYLQCSLIAVHPLRVSNWARQTEETKRKWWRSKKLLKPWHPRAMVSVILAQCQVSFKIIYVYIDQLIWFSNLWLGSSLPAFVYEISGRHQSEYGSERRL